MYAKSHHHEYSLKCNNFFFIKQVFGKILQRSRGLFEGGTFIYLVAYWFIYFGLLNLCFLLKNSSRFQWFILFQIIRLIIFELGPVHLSKLNTTWSKPTKNNFTIAAFIAILSGVFNGVFSFSGVFNQITLIFESQRTIIV